MLDVILAQIAAEGIWQLILDAMKTLWEKVRKSPQRSDSDEVMAPHGEKRPKRQSSSFKKSWSIKFEYEKRMN